MDWGMFAGIIAVIGIQTALFLWMMSKLDSDIKAVSSEVKAVAADSNAKWMAACSRIDEMGSRIDQTQAIIMRMLEKQGR